jgi:hypothetical protein
MSNTNTPSFKGNKVLDMNKLDQKALEAMKAWILRKPFYHSSTPDKLIKNPNISLGAKTVFNLMHSYSPKKKLQTENVIVEIAIETIAKNLGISEKSAQKYIHELISTGWITRIKGGSQNSSSRYRLWSMGRSEFEGALAHIRIMERLKVDHDLCRRLTASLHNTGKKTTTVARENRQFTTQDSQCPEK